MLPDGAGVLECRVSDSLRIPVAGATVTVHTLDRRQEFAGQTSPYGTFSMVLPAGSYRVAVTADSFTPAFTTVTIRSGETNSLDNVTLDLAKPSALPAPGDWDIDPEHSNIGFSARHIGMSHVRGRFNRFAGVIRIAETIEHSAMHVVIDAASIDTNVKRRDDHLRSSDFLDVENYPVLEFYGERMIHRGGSRWSVPGTLSLHGVSRNVALETEYFGLGTGAEGDIRAACRATTELHREDYTLTWQTMLARGIAVVGSVITIDLDVQIIEKAPR
ncbi:YceI family protein [Streptomyces zhihengii]